MLTKVQFTTTRHSYMQNSPYENKRSPYRNPSFGDKKVFFKCISEPFNLMTKVHTYLRDNLKNWICSTSETGYVVEIIKPNNGKKDAALYALEKFINETNLAKAEIIDFPKQN